MVLSDLFAFGVFKLVSSFSSSFLESVALALDPFSVTPLGSSLLFHELKIVSSLITSLWFGSPTLSWLFFSELSASFCKAQT